MEEQSPSAGGALVESCDARSARKMQKVGVEVAEARQGRSTVFVDHLHGNLKKKKKRKGTVAARRYLGLG